MSIPQFATLAVLVVVGWMCTRYPATITRLSTMHVRNTSREKGQDLARLVRTDPEEWQRRFPEQVYVIRLAGFIAYFIALIGFGLWLLSLFSGTGT